MITAVFGVHWPLFFAPKGIEYPTALGAMSIALAFPDVSTGIPAALASEIGEVPAKVGTGRPGISP